MTPHPSGRQRLVLVADPGVPSEIAGSLAPRLPHHLSRAVSGRAEWVVDVFTAPLAGTEQVDVSDIADAVSRHLHGIEWDVAVFITDLPRRARRHPISVEIDAEHRAAVISLPALGLRRLRRRVRQAIVDIVRQLVTRNDAPQHPEVIGRPPRQAGPGTAGASDTLRRYVVPGLRGHVRLVFGMVHANRPWRLFGSLSRGLAGVFATATVLFMNTASWNLATTLGAWQHAVVTALAASALTAWVIIDHDLWERADEDLPARHHPFYPYNLVTLITIALAVVVLAAVLFGTLVAVSFLLLAAAVLQKTIGRPVGPGDYVFLAWFITAIAMVGGAFGTSLETDDAVRDAAYGRRQRARQRQLKEMLGETDDDTDTPPDRPGR
jgi:heme exporter protein D